MKAHDARERVYRSNKKLKGIKDLDVRIAEAADAGNFSITSLVHYDWGSVSALEEHYTKLGFEVSSYYKQTSPNDSDDYICISWDEK